MGNLKHEEFCQLAEIGRQVAYNITYAEPKKLCPVCMTQYRIQAIPSTTKWPETIGFYGMCLCHEEAFGKTAKADFSVIRIDMATIQDSLNRKISVTAICTGLKGVVEAAVDITLKQRENKNV